MPPALLQAGAVAGSAGGGYGPFTVGVSHAVPAGAALILFMGDGWDDGPVVTSVTDSKGNTYGLDVAQNYAGGTSVCVASSIIATPLTISDTLTVTVSGGRVNDVFVVHGSSFSGVEGLHAAGVVVDGTGGLDAQVTPASGDLVIAALADRLTGAPTDAGWTALATAYNPGSISHASVAYQVAPSAAALDFITAATGGGHNAVSVAVAYTALPSPLSPSGIGSGEAFGDATIDQLLYGAGIGSGETLGSPGIFLGETLLPDAIPSGEAFGDAVVNANALISPEGIPSAETFGVTALDSIKPDGIPSGEVFGDALVLAEGEIFAVGIPSGEALGALGVLSFGEVAIRPAGWGGEAVGTPEVTVGGPTTIYPVGIE